MEIFTKTFYSHYHKKPDLINHLISYFNLSFKLKMFVCSCCIYASKPEIQRKL